MLNSVHTLKAYVKTPAFLVTKLLLKNTVLFFNKSHSNHFMTLVYVLEHGVVIPNSISTDSNYINQNVVIILFFKHSSEFPCFKALYRVYPKYKGERGIVSFLKDFIVS